MLPLVGNWKIVNTTCLRTMVSLLPLKVEVEELGGNAVYIANFLGKYNEGELVGAWFTPPVDFEEVKERIGLNDEYEEYAIHDYELPFAIDEYTPIEEVNRLCEMVEDLPEYIQENYRSCNPTFGSIERTL